jgi:hypothetical protein
VFHVVLEHDLLDRIGQLQACDPAPVTRRPGALAGIPNAVAQQQRLELVTRRTLRTDRILTGTRQISDRLVGLVGHVHRRELARARQPRQLQAVTPIGLDALARSARNHRRGPSRRSRSRARPTQHEAR